MKDLRVAYVLLRFPQLTETFIAEEIRHMEAKALGLQLYSILHSKDTLVHPVSKQLLPQVRYLPGLRAGSLWSAQAHFLRTESAKYLGLLAEIWQAPCPDFAFRVKRLYVFFKAIWLAGQLQREPVDLVHVHFAWLPVIAGLTVNRLLDTPFTFTAHAYDIYSDRNDLLPLAARHAERIITISEANKAAILEMVPGISPAKIEVIRCGIDLDLFHSMGPKSRSQSIQITSVGSLLPKKGHEYLIRACGELQAQGVDFQCVIVGAGALERPLQDLIDRLGLKARVSLAGARSQDQVRDQLNSSDVFVLACVSKEDTNGDRDGIPVAIMEAMAMGLPVISTPVSGIPELVQDQETGLLVAQQNAVELAAAIMRIADDEELRSKLAASALKLICNEYDIVKNTSRLKALFEQAASATCISAGYWE